MGSRLRRFRALSFGVALGVGVALSGAHASACGWSWETYAAEGQSLPCVHDAVLGYFPKHTREYHEAVIEAAGHALRWAPGWTSGLDAQGLSLLHLGRLAEARRVMDRRLQIAPDAYASHANLGTLLTFTRDYTAALAEVDRALKIEPKAHFGREKYHRKLVEFLLAVARDPEVAKARNFLDVRVSAEQRLNGSVEAYRAAGLEGASSCQNGTCVATPWQDLFGTWCGEE